MINSKIYIILGYILMGIVFTLTLYNTFLFKNNIVIITSILLQIYLWGYSLVVVLLLHFNLFHLTIIIIGVISINVILINDIYWFVTGVISSQILIIKFVTLSIVPSIIILYYLNHKTGNGEKIEKNLA